MSVLETPNAAEPPESVEPGRYDAFLSYAREDAEFVVRWLVPLLRERGREVWVDVDITGGARWRDRVRRGIEACKALIFVVSPSSIISDACRGELEDAVALNKKVIPLVFRDVEERSMPAPLGDLEWVLLREHDDQAVGLDRLVDALETDLEWRDQHTRIAGRAREWLDSRRNTSYLLRGADLHEAEEWFARQGEHRQAPTPEQGEYITRSRQAAGRRLYTVIGALSLGLLIAIGLAVFALIQRQNAITQSHAAQSRALAASSLLALGDDPELSLLLARQAIGEQDTPQAREALRTALATSRVRRTMVAQNVVLGWAWFTPDDSKVVANGAGPSYVWDARTGRLVRTLYNFRYQRPLLKSELSRDGSHLMIVPNIGPPVVMDVAGRTAPVKLVDPTDSWFTDAALAPDGRYAVAVTLHTEIARLFDTRSGRILGRFPGHFGRVAISDNGRFVALAGTHSVTTFDLLRGKQDSTIPANGSGPYPSIAFSPDGALYVVTRDAARSWNPVGGKPLATLAGVRTNASGSTAAWPLAFSRDGSKVAGVTAGGQLSIWNATTGRLDSHIVPAANQNIFAVALSPDGRYAVTADGDGVARVWSTQSEALVSELRGVAGGVNSVEFASDGRRVLTAGEDGTARIWDAGLGLPDKQWSASDLLGGTVGSLSGRWAFNSSPEGERNIAVLDSASGRHAFAVKLPRPAWDAAIAARAPVILVIYQGARAEILNMASGRMLASLPGTERAAVAGQVSVHSPAISADGRRVMIARGNTLTVWDVSTRRPLGSVNLPSSGLIPRASASAFSYDDRLVATVGTDGVVVLWRAADGHVIAREHTERSPGFNASAPVAPAFSADNSLFVAAGNWDRTPGIWRTSDGQAVANLTQPYDTVAFSPNGPLIVTDGAFVWDAESGRKLLTLRDPTGNGLDTAAFTADGLHVIGDVFGERELFSCDVCGSLKQLLALAAQRITRRFTPAERNRYLR